MARSLLLLSLCAAVAYSASLHATNTNGKNNNNAPTTSIHEWRRHLNSYSASACLHPPPPRGWDSFDSAPIPITFNETQTLASATIMKSMNAAGAGLKYLVLDEGWSEQAIGDWFLDDYGRPIPNPFLFPSSGSSGGFAPLVKQLREEYQLKLGLWMIKGITKQAVEMKLPIKNTPYTADQIALSTSCKWHTDVFAINMSHPGGQAYYNSIAELYIKEWGVEYIKIDCVFGDYLDTPEVEGFAAAVEQYQPSSNSNNNNNNNNTAATGVIITSLSPGGQVSTKEATEVGTYATMYRMTEDLHDCWSRTDHCPSSVVEISALLPSFAIVMDSQRRDNRTGCFPDPDMLPLGVIIVGSAQPHLSHITSPAMARYLYGLWSITRSPIIHGGSMESINNTDYLFKLFTNPSLTTLSQCSAHPQVVATSKGFNEGVSSGWVVWGVQHGAIHNAIYIGFFPFSDDKHATDIVEMSISWSDVLKVFRGGVPNNNNNNNNTSISGQVAVFDVITEESKGHWQYDSDKALTVKVPVNDAAIYAMVAI